MISLSFNVNTHCCGGKRKSRIDSAMRNNHYDFIGVSEMKKMHCAQITKFEEWSQRGYEEFHYNHYDWWAFPIDQPSSFGFKYMVLSDDIDELKKDTAFMARFKRGLDLIFESWGWSLSQSCVLPWYSISQYQRWQVMAKLNIILKAFHV
jgi:hypothetical protein